MSDNDVPAGFEPLSHGGAFGEHVGPLYIREEDGVIGLRVEDRHLNAAGTAMGGLLATLVDVALGRAVPRHTRTCSSRPWLVGYPASSG